MPPPASRWKAPRSRGTQKKDKKRLRSTCRRFWASFHNWSRDGNQPVFRSSPFCENGTAERPQTLRCPQIINVFPLKMPKATRRAFKSLYPPKGAQDHIRSISASTSSMRVAQLVAMRTTVWVSSNFSQKPNFALPSSAASWAFSSTRKIWLVGESIKKR